MSRVSTASARVIGCFAWTNAFVVGLVQFERREPGSDLRFLEDELRGAADDDIVWIVVDDRHDSSKRRRKDIWESFLRALERRKPSREHLQKCFPCGQPTEKKCQVQSGELMSGDVGRATVAQRTGVAMTR